MAKQQSFIHPTSQRELIASLLEEKNTLVSQGKYLEAETIKQQISHIIHNSHSNKTFSLSETQDKQNEHLEESFNNEFISLAHHWETRLTEFITKCDQNEKEMLTSHSNQMEMLMNNLTSKYPSMKYSKHYLEMKQKEINHAKQEQYKDAHYYKCKCEQMEKVESENYIKKRNEHIQMKCELLGHKQENERKCLRNKFNRQFELLNKQKEIEFEKLKLKYKNLKKELDNVHKKQRDNEWAGRNKRNDNSNAVAMSKMLDKYTGGINSGVHSQEVSIGYNEDIGVNEDYKEKDDCQDTSGDVHSD